MRKILIVLVAAGAALASITPADAREGCGPGFHRGPHARCFPNHGRGYGADRGRYRGHGYRGRIEPRRHH